MINRLVFYIVKQTRWESKGIVKMSIDELISIIVEPLLALNCPLCQGHFELV